MKQTIRLRNCIIADLTASAELPCGHQYLRLLTPETEPFKWVKAFVFTYFTLCVMKSVLHLQNEIAILYTVHTVHTQSQSQSQVMCWMNECIRKCVHVVSLRRQSVHSTELENAILNCILFWYRCWCTETTSTPANNINGAYDVFETGINFNAIFIGE